MMKNRFTITISDVYGARHYSFAQIVKRFAGWVIASLALIFLMVAISLGWTLQKNQQIEEKHQFAVELYSDRLAMLQAKYESALKEKMAIEQVLSEKNAQVDELDLKLQGLEELVMGVDASVPSETATAESDRSGGETPLSEADDENWQTRLNHLQVSVLAKQYLLEVIPSGPAVKEFKGFSSLYGMRMHPVLGRKKMHYGIDYKGPRGGEVIATAEGVVMFAGDSSVGFGKMITLSHANGFKTRYGHLDKMLVKSGEFVRKGQKIGEIGNSGRSTAPHLHYEVLFLSRRIDPKPFHAWSWQNFDSIFTEVKQIPWVSFVDSANWKIEQAEKQLLPAVVSATVN